MMPNVSLQAGRLLRQAAAVGINTGDRAQRQSLWRGV